MFKTGIFSNFIILLSAKIIRIKNDRVFIYRRFDNSRNYSRPWIYDDDILIPEFMIPTEP